ncbi:MAG: hypothetical protein KatS3mg090_0519 [Patescibacteria group bacterium]|nr:MAG: hypothetical protein KatS3mg090_0519 [Patescibacteria group bacterium]
MTENKTIFLSPSKLNLYQDCPYCFYLAMIYKKRRPEQPASTLPRGLDNLIKKYFDFYRSIKQLPPEIDKQIKGKLLEDQNLINEWRKTTAFSEPRVYLKELNTVIFGGLDECIIEDDKYIPADYKTRGYDLKEDSTSYYQTQMDCYNYLLYENGYQTANLAYLIYYIPKKINKDGVVNFKVEIHSLQTNKERFSKLVKSAVEILRSGKPKRNLNCQFCQWMDNID